MRIVDTRGQQCPAPLIATRKALKDSQTGESFTVLTDNKTSFENVSRYLKDNSILFNADEKNGIWTITVTRGVEPMPAVEAEKYCTTGIPHLNQGDFVIAFSSDKMGEGDDELGRLLVINFVKAVKDLDVLPSKLVFYNSGVKLGTEDSPVCDHLKEIESMGVRLYFCATCVNFYSLQEKVRLGTLSNMFEIAQALASAGNVIKP
jgi:selenium metabolism protein YedF